MCISTNPKVRRNKSTYAALVPTVYILQVIVRYYPKSVGLIDSNEETSLRAKAKTRYHPKKKRLESCLAVLQPLESRK